MNLEIGTEAAQFPEKESVNGILVAVQIVVPLARPNVRRRLIYIKSSPVAEDNIWRPKVFFVKTFWPLIFLQKKTIHMTAEVILVKIFGLWLQPS